MCILRIGFIYFIGIFTSLSLNVQGFPGGSPAFGCVGMVPMHWEKSTDPYSMDMKFYQPQTKESNIRITTNPTSYKVGDNVTITVESTDSEMILGLVLVVNRKVGLIEEPLGTFLDCPNSMDKVKMLSYFPQEAKGNNCVTHKKKEGVKKIECVWKAVSNEADIEAAATVVKVDEDYYWYRITKEITALDTPNKSPTPSTTALSLFPEINNCGSTKSCFVYPKLCEQVGNCKYMLSYKLNAAEKTVSIEMSGLKTGWIAMGISNDEIMDKDLVIGCLETKEKGKAIVVTATTAYATLPNAEMKMHYVMPTINKNIKNKKAGILNDWSGNQYIVCSFDVPYLAVAEFQNTAGYGDALFNLENEDVFVFMGDGVTFTGTNFMLMHSQRPLISPKTRLTKTSHDMAYFDGMLKRTRIHSTLQIIAWMFCSSLGVLLARHYRPNLSKQLNKGPYKQWFLWHLLFIVTTMILAIISFIYILASIGYWKAMPTIHGALGIVTISLGLINILMGAVGVMKCAPQNTKRWVFDWLHWIVGALTRLSAIITFWLAIRIYGHRDAFDLMGTIVVAVWTGGEIFFFFYFLIKKKVAYWKAKNEYSCPQSRSTIKDEYRTDSYVRHAGILDFIFYLIFIIGVTMALLFAVWLY